MEYLSIFFKEKCLQAIFFFFSQRVETYNFCCGQHLSVEDSFNNAALQQTDRGRQISGRFSGQLHSSAAK